MRHVLQYDRRFFRNNDLFACTYCDTLSESFQVATIIVEYSFIQSLARLEFILIQGLCFCKLCSNEHNIFMQHCPTLLAVVVTCWVVWDVLRPLGWLVRSGTTFDRNIRPCIKKQLCFYFFDTNLQLHSSFPPNPYLYTLIFFLKYFQ